MDAIEGTETVELVEVSTSRSDGVDLAQIPNLISLRIYQFLPDSRK